METLGKTGFGIRRRYRLVNNLGMPRFGDHGVFFLNSRIASLVRVHSCTKVTVPELDLSVLGTGCRLCFAMDQRMLAYFAAIDDYVFPSRRVAEERDRILRINFIIAVSVKSIRINVHIPTGDVTK